MQVSISMFSSNKRRRHSSSILTVQLKQDSKEIVDVGTDIISLAIIEMTG
jgi:hypothetical protein